MRGFSSAPAGRLPAVNALVLSLAGVAKAATFPDAQLLRDAGWNVTLVVGRLGDEAHVPEGVRVIELADAEGITALSRLERFAVWWLPRVVLRVVRRLLQKAEEAGYAERLPDIAVSALPTLMAAQPRYSGLAHRRWLIGPYKSVRPFILWRLVRRCAWPELIDAGRDLVVVGDHDSVAIGWHLARALPATPVTFGIDTERLPAGTSRGSAVPA
jgi:hypothetical protein